MKIVGNALIYLNHSQINTKPFQEPNKENLTMSSEPLRIIHKDDLPEGGFAGIVETRMVISPSMSAEATANKEISHGLNDFIYLASGHFKPNDGAPIHPHQDVDIVTIVLNGAVGHKGTLGDGTIVEGPAAQVQRAGTGMQHSEYNMNDTNSEFIQIWFRPPKTGLSPAYQNFEFHESVLTTVLGGENDDAFHSNMICQVGNLDKDQSVISSIPFVALITKGSATANGALVKAGDLIEGNSLNLMPHESVGLVLIQDNSAFTKTTKK